MNDNLGRKRSEEKQALIPSAQYKADDRREITCLMKQEPPWRLLGGIQSNRFTEAVFIGDSIKARHDCLSTHVAHPANNPTVTGNNPTQHKPTALSELHSLTHDNTPEETPRSPGPFLSSAFWLSLTFRIDSTFRSAVCPPSRVS